MNRIAITTVAVAALLGLSACGVSAEKAAEATAAPAATSQAATAPSSAPAKPKENHSALMVKFGETIQYEDKLSVTIKHTGTVVASQYAAPETARGQEVQLFEITLTNGSDTTYEPSGFYDTAVFGTAGAKAEAVFDSSSGVSTGYFSGVMVPGGTQTITTALAVPTAELSTVVYSVRPSFAHKAAVVTGGL
jgi:hypothetical protein